MKKGQMSQLFIYIFALFIFITILFFGYRAINEFLGRGEQIAFVKFKTNLEKTVKGASSYGTRRVFDRDGPFQVPDKYQQICFVNLDKNPPPNVDPVIKESWSSAYEAGGYEAGEQNVFLKPLAPEPIKVYEISVDSNEDGVEDNDERGILCINISEGNLYMKLEGKGDHTFITNMSG